MRSLYIIDSSLLITAFRNYYAMDIVPSFWEQLQSFANQGIICTIDKVKNEIDRIDDDLKIWFHSNFLNNNPPIPFDPENRRNENLFLFGSSENEWNSYKEIISWAENQNYKTAAKNEFKSSEVADAFLIAFCKTHNLILVTEEKFDSNQRKKIPIPNVCEQFGIEYINTFELMRTLGIRI